MRCDKSPSGTTTTNHGLSGELICPSHDNFSDSPAFSATPCSPVVKVRFSVRSLNVCWPLPRAVIAIVTWFDWLAVLDKVCNFGCEEYTDLKKAVARFKAAGNKYVAAQ